MRSIGPEKRSSVSFPYRGVGVWLVLGLGGCSNEAQRQSIGAIGTTQLAVTVSNVASSRTFSACGVPNGEHGKSALPAGCEASHQPSASCHPSTEACAKAPSSASCDSCAFDSYCPKSGGTCTPYDGHGHCGGSSALPDLVLEYPCADSAGHFHFPVCNRGTGAVTSKTITIGLYAGTSSYPACAGRSEHPSERIDFALEQPLEPGECVDVRADTASDCHFSDPTLQGLRTVVVNANGSIAESNPCNNSNVWVKDACQDPPPAGSGGSSSSGGASSGSAPPSSGGAANGSGGASGAGPTVDAGNLETGGAGGSITVDAGSTGGSTAGSGSVDAGNAGGSSALDAGVSSVPPICTAPPELTAALGLLGADGNAIPVSVGATTVSVQTRSAGGAWVDASNIVVAFEQPPALDVVLVVDNSGSETGNLATEVSAVHGFATALFAANSNNRLGMVRVSTSASKLLELTSDVTAVDSATSALFINKGWTALWDGVELANDVLEDGPARPTPTSSCYAGSYRSVVVFTDGQDNNSAGEKDTLGTHLSTTLDDLLSLSTDGMRTAVYTVGIGKRIDTTSLGALASGTGGEYLHIDDWSSLVGTLDGTATKLTLQAPICFSPATCDAVEARTVVTTMTAGQTFTAEHSFALPSE